MVNARKDETLDETKRKKKSWTSDTIWFFHLYFKELAAKARITKDHEIVLPDPDTIVFPRLYPGFETHLTFDGPRLRCRDEVYLQVMANDLKTEGIRIGERAGSFRKLAKATSKQEGRIALERAWRSFRDLMLTMLPAESRLCKQKRPAMS